MVIVDNPPEIIRKITTLFAPDYVKMTFYMEYSNHLKNLL